LLVQQDDYSQPVFLAWVGQRASEIPQHNSIKDGLLRTNCCNQFAGERSFHP
jgi:hypothetical protein